MSTVIAIRVPLCFSAASLSLAPARRSWRKRPCKALRLELRKDESKRMDIDDFLETVRRYTDATTITKRMVAELIDHIEVYHAEKQDGITNQRVVIHYNCIGAFDVPDRRKIPEADIIMETRKGVALSYAPEQVAV